MKKTTLLAVFAFAWVYASISAREQPAADCKPNPLNIPGAPYPCLHPDNRGKDDTAMKGAKTLHQALEQAGIKHTFQETEGAHHWRVGRR